MSRPAERNARALTLLIVWSVALAVLFATLLALIPAARAGTCDQVGGVITGDWTITNTQVCSGILYSVDGTINVNSGGSLTLTDGGLSFSKDTSHAGYALNVNGGGELILDNSIVTTQTDSIAPFLRLAFTVSGANSRFTMKNGAILKFPGWFNATSATINVTDSKITGFTDSEISGLGINTDDNNDAPLMAWATTTASLYRSRIERLYEYTGGTAGNILLTATSNLYSYDSYIGVDYSNTPGVHNELRVDGTSNAYLYNVTIDRTQDPAAKADWVPAFRPTAAGGNVDFMRWLHATVVDSSGIPVSGATIWSTLSPSSTTAQYPDNALAATPTARTLWYLGRTASGANAWNRTDANGLALIPLFTDQITTASLPNAESFGNYHQQLTGVREDPLGRSAHPGQLHGLEQLSARLLRLERRNPRRQPRERAHLDGPGFPRHAPRRRSHVERRDLRFDDRRERHLVRRQRHPRARFIPRSRLLDRHGSDDAPLGRDPHRRHDPRVPHG